MGAETWTSCDGLNMAADLNLNNLQVETDASLVVAALNSHRDVSYALSSIICDSRTLLTGCHVSEIC